MRRIWPILPVHAPRRAATLDDPSTGPNSGGAGCPRFFNTQATAI